MEDPSVLLSNSTTSADAIKTNNRKTVFNPFASVNFNILENDPFEDGDITEGISAHMAAGNSFESIIAFAVNERNYLRLQNGKLWMIIEKQKMIIEGLKGQISELKEMYEKGALVLSQDLETDEEEFASKFRTARGSRRTSGFRDESSSVLMIPSISEIRKSINEACEEELAIPGTKSNNGQEKSSKRKSMFSPTVPDDQVDAYNSLVTSFMPESNSDSGPSHAPTATRPSHMSSANAGNDEDLARNTVTAKTRATSPPPQDRDTASVEERPSSSMNGRRRSRSVPNMSLNGMQPPSLQPGDDVQIRISGSTFQGGGVDGTLYYFMVKKDKTGEEWRIEKRYSDFVNLEAKLRTKLSKPVFARVGKLPEKSLFTSVNPVKSDQRKVGLEMYLHRVLYAAPDAKEMCEFLTKNLSIPAVNTSNVLGNDPSGDIDDVLGSSFQMTVLKEGYLMKRGNHFGGWKPKYFKCKPYFLDFSEGPKRDIISTISLKHCHVSPLRTNQGDAKAAHGFVLTEFHKEYYPVPLDLPIPDSKIFQRHILAADDDKERDEWVSVLQGQILDARGLGKITATTTATSYIATADKDSSKGQSPTTLTLPTPFANSMPLDSITPRGSRGTGGVGSPLHGSGSVLESTSLGSIPALSASHFATTGPSVTPLKNAQDDNARAMVQHPRPMPRGASLKELKELNQPSARDSMVASPLGFGVTKNSAVKGLMNMRNAFTKKKTETSASKVPDPNRLVFGVPLEHALNISRISEDIDLPAVVYRCIEYLEHVKAADEEGIYRLSGSSNTIQQLKLMFNLDGDVDLVNSNEPYEVHAVSGLLKLFLRELPTPVLSANLQPQFMNISELDDRNDRVLELARLVSLLPKANYTLLQVLISHLVTIVQASEKNKMTVRNVGIVFAPTLGVPALVFILLVAEFDTIFCWDDPVLRKETQGKIDEMREKAKQDLEEDKALPGVPHSAAPLLPAPISSLGTDSLLSETEMQQIMG